MTTAPIRSNISVWLELVDDGNTVLDISSCSINYSLNRIPMATNISVMVGKNITENKAADQALSGKLKRHTRIVIRFAALYNPDDLSSKISGPGGATFPEKAYVTKFPAKQGEGIVIFYGATSNVGFQKTVNILGGTTGYSLSAVGFLNDLAGASTAETSYAEESKGSTARFLKEKNDLTQQQFAINTVTFASSLMDEKSGIYLKLFKNLWKGGLSAALKRCTNSISNSAATKLLDEATESEVSNLNGNTKDRVVMCPVWMSSGGNDVISFVPLYGDPSTSAKHKEIVHSIANMMHANYMSQNVWDSMVGMARLYHMAVIPSIEGYSVVPFTPNLRGDPYRKIYADEYDTISDSASYEVPLRRIVITATEDNGGTTSGSPTQNGVKYKESAAYPPYGQDVYTAAGSTVRARTKFIQVPDFLKGSTHLLAFAVNQIESERQAIKRDRQAFKQSNAITAYAKLEYFLHVFSSTRSTITGRLRFDIGPGSLVEIESALQTAEVSKVAGKTESIYGVIEEVVLNYQATVSSGGTVETSFILGATRTKTEHDDQINTDTVHPLYNNAWKGTPLMQDPGTLRKA